MRDLIRGRKAALRACDVAKHQLSRFLLRNDRIYPGKTLWCGKHSDWLRTQKFDHLAQKSVMRDYLHEVERLQDRVGDFDTSIEELYSKTRPLPLVNNLRALWGIATLTAATIAFEVIHFRRFSNARQFMSFLGLVPSVTVRRCPP